MGSGNAPQTPGPVTVYLAGPEVFLPDGREVLEQKRSMLRDCGLTPVEPPADVGPLEADTPWERGLEISRRNEDLIRSADACLANLTPFRGPSADPGTVYELGFAAALGKHMAGYSNIPELYGDRVRDVVHGGAECTAREGKLWGPDGVMVEDHGMVDNLMLDGGVHLRGGVLLAAETAPADPARDLGTFERTARAFAQHLGL